GIRDANKNTVENTVKVLLIRRDYNWKEKLQERKSKSATPPIVNTPLSKPLTRAANSTQMSYSCADGSILAESVLRWLTPVGGEFDRKGTKYRAHDVALDSQPGGSTSEECCNRSSQKNDRAIDSKAYENLNSAENESLGHYMSGRWMHELRNQRQIHERNLGVE